MDPVCYYSILNVPKTASFDEIKKAYRSLLLKAHPDKKTGTQNEFMSISKAWEILSCPDKRKLYDSRTMFNELQTIAISEKVFIGDFERDDGYYYYRCRCQDDYAIAQEDVDFLIKFINCSGCSSSIEILYQIQK